MDNHPWVEENSFSKVLEPHAADLGRNVDDTTVISVEKHSPRLPLEVILYIIEFLGDDPSTLSVCSLTSKSITPACQAELFRTIDLSLLSSSHPSSHPTQADRLLNRLIESPHIGTFIRAMTIRSYSQQLAPPDPSVGQLLTSIASFGVLAQFKLVGRMQAWLELNIPQDAVNSLLKIGSLRILTIAHVRFIPASILASATHVRCFKLLFASVSPEPLNPALTLPRPYQVDSITWNLGVRTLPFEIHELKALTLYPLNREHLFKPWEALFPCFGFIERLFLRISSEVIDGTTFDLSLFSQLRILTLQIDPWEYPKPLVDLARTLRTRRQAGIQNVKVFLGNLPRKYPSELSADLAAWKEIDEAFTQDSLSSVKIVVLGLPQAFASTEDTMRGLLPKTQSRGLLRFQYYRAFL